MATISKGPTPQLKLDLYDKKIIFYLSQDSRIATSTLAKRLRISQQRTQYKIERLKKELLEPAAFMNFQLLDIQQYIIFTGSLDDETIEALMQAKEIYFLMQSLGEYQWIINIVTNNIDEFCKKYLGKVHFKIQLIDKATPDDYNPFHLNIKPDPLKQDKPLTLDAKDYRLLSHLARHPDHPITTISEATGLDRKTISKRNTAYTKNNLIQKFRYSINIFKLGCIAYILNIQYAPNNKEQLLEHIRKDHYAGFVFTSTNEYTMHYLPPSHTELRAFIKTLEAVEPTIKIQVMQNTEFFKVQLVPDSVAHLFQKHTPSQ